MSAQVMLDAICEAALVAVQNGEHEISITVRREVTRPDDQGVSDIEHIVVRAFHCAHADTCGRSHHVVVEAISGRYEYPDHLGHRSDES